MPNNPITPTAEAYVNGTIINASYINNLASALNRKVGYATQATANSTKTLVIGDAELQEFTGTTAGQVVKMPVVSTLGLGMAWVVSNRSTQTIAVQSSDGSAIVTVPANTDVTITCILLTGTTAASWSVSFTGTSAATSPDKVVQIVNFQTGTPATGTTILPNDGTIPQNTEGTQFMALAITPTNAANILVIQIVARVSHSLGNTDVGAALFQDATAGALAATGLRQTGTGVPTFLVLTYRMVAGTTSSTTFKVRIGSADAGTLTFCPDMYGQVPSSSITITEHTP